MWASPEKRKELEKDLRLLEIRKRVSSSSSLFREKSDVQYLREGVERLAFIRLYLALSEGFYDLLELLPPFLLRLRQRGNKETLQEVIYVISMVTSQAGINLLWKVLHDHPALDELTQVLRRNQWPATEPVEVQAFSLLLLGQEEQIDREDPQAIQAVAGLLGHPSPVVRNLAEKYLQKIDTPSLRTLLCEYWAEYRVPALERLLVSKKYIQLQRGLLGRISRGLGLK
jgi:hypothetical protein